MITKSCLIFLFCIATLQGRSQSFVSSSTQMKIIQLTSDNSGHTIHNTQCFSPDDQWIVFDTRNNDTLIRSTGNISMVNTRTGEITELYHTRHQTEYGPGVGAASFCPVSNRVIFIHGVRNSDKIILMDLHAELEWLLI